MTIEIQFILRNSIIKKIGRTYRSSVEGSKYF